MTADAGRSGDTYVEDAYRYTVFEFVDLKMGLSSLIVLRERFLGRNLLDPALLAKLPTEKIVGVW